MKGIKLVTYWLMIMVLVITLGFVGCSKETGSGSNKSVKAEDKNAPQTITIGPETSKTALYYQGYVQPITLYNVTSPVDGVVESLSFEYGRHVNKGQLLLTIASKELIKNYQTALSSYLTAKQKYYDSLNQISGTKILYDDGLIPRNDYVTALDNLQNARFDLIQSRLQLVEILELSGAPLKAIENLQMGDPKAIKAALKRHISVIKINAPHHGITLIPAKNTASDSSNSSSQKLFVGSQVKSGQTLLQLGDLSGISVNINVDEISINQITNALKAEVTSPAFPGIILTGKIASINAQASTSNSGGLPTFTVKVDVPHISFEQRKYIHVGMSAKVKITIVKNKQIVVPISAVFQKNDTSYVKIYNPKTRQIKDVEVKTGHTTQTDVVILKGLKTGDKVVINS